MYWCYYPKLFWDHFDGFINVLMSLSRSVLRPFWWWDCALNNILIDWLIDWTELRWWRHRVRCCSNCRCVIPSSEVCTWKSGLAKFTLPNPRVCSSHTWYWEIAIDSPLRSLNARLSYVFSTSLSSVFRPDSPLASLPVPDLPALSLSWWSTLPSAPDDRLTTLPVPDLPALSPWSTLPFAPRQRILPASCLSSVCSYL